MPTSPKEARDLFASKSSQWEIWGPAEISRQAERYPLHVLSKH